VDSAHQTYVADAQEEVRVMTQLVNELLAYAKAGLKTTAVTLERVQLHSLVERIIAREATEEAEINVEIDKGLYVTAQPELLARAVGNLIRNAIRYAGTAGPITISAHREDQRIRLSIKDSGTGVPEDALEKLFDPFYRLEADRARNTGGAGLGLAIVKSCVEACQGTVSARNCQPRGFEVNLSLSAATE
jgi:two-component system sensor histidine kinase CpxA